MTGPIHVEAPTPASISRRARLVLAILSSLVLLVALGVVEIGALTAITVVSSTRNHGGGQ